MPTSQRSLSVEQISKVNDEPDTTSKQKKQLTRACSQPKLDSKDGAAKSPSPTCGRRKNKKTVKKKKKFVISANLAMTKYSLVREVCKDFGFNILETTTNDCLLVWSDSAVPLEKIAELKSYQKINHFPGMGEICRKDSLARNIWKMQKCCPGEFNFVPQTWILPGEYAMFQFSARELKRKKRGRTYIRKPVNGAMGHGIWLTRNPDKITPNDVCIVQEYLDKPLLMDGYKFDLRMYVLVTSCDPLKIFLYKDGLVRMGTEPYVAPCESNLSHSFMHLTNYSINKYSENFIETSEENLGTKRTLTYFWNWLKEKSHDIDVIWNRISDVIIKTVLVSTPHLFHTYHMCRGIDAPSSSCCFEILGFDIFMDKKLKPWVLEVNRAPSFGADQELDYEIKYGLLSSALKLLNLKSSERRRCLKAEKIAAQKRLMGMTTTKKTDEQVVDKVGNKKKLLQKRKSDLKWRLKELRAEADRKEYEEKNRGKYCCIYPPSTKSLADHYGNILSECTKVVTGRTSLRKETSPLHGLKEEEILDLLQEVENDVLHLVDSDGRLILKGPTPLSTMPTSQKPVKKIRVPTTKISALPSPYLASPRMGIKSTICLPVNQTYNATIQFSSAVDEEEKLLETLQLLRNMKIKFPGKSDEEAEELLEKIQQDWMSHRPRVAAYWLVKLDSVKRKKVIDIVKSNVHIILQRVWKVAEIDSTSLYRLFVKLFNRLLWNHGQGLWNCFNANNESWESILVKGLDQFSETKMQCCREVVKLCCDCLLVVYQFASETRPVNLTSTVNFDSPKLRIHSSRSYSAHDKISPRMSAGFLMGSKITKLYR